MQWIITHTVTQTIEAETAEKAEKIGRQALENADSLWWPVVRKPLSRQADRLEDITD